MSILKSEAFKRTWRQERVSHSKSWRMRNTFQEVRIARKCKSPQAWANLAGLVPQLSGAGRIHLIYKQPTDLYWCIVIAVRAWVLGRGGKWYGCGEENGRICDNLAPVTQDGYPLVYTVSVWHRKVMLMSFTFYSVNIWEDQDMFLSEQEQSLIRTIQSWCLENGQQRARRETGGCTLCFNPSKQQLVHGTVFDSFTREPVCSLRCFELGDI